MTRESFIEAEGMPSAILSDGLVTIPLFAVSSIVLSDYNAIMGFTVWAGMIFIVVNLVVDLAHTLVDSRERAT